MATAAPVLGEGAGHGRNEMRRRLVAPVAIWEGRQIGNAAGSGSTTLRAALEAHQPPALAGHTASAGQFPGGATMKILLPIDGSACAKPMLGYVAAHDELFGPDHEYLALLAVPAIPVWA
jgi:hypothetical protein